MKQRISVWILLFLLLTLTACRSQSGGRYYGDAVTKDTLQICIDPTGNLDEYELGKRLEELGRQIKDACEIERLTFELLPREGVEREAALQRLRTEIMSGDGPDLFILHTSISVPDGSTKNALFKFPEKNMESGLFLPLDAYMENHTQFTDWDMQTKAVLDAGRNDEGQLIIPMTYSFPVLVYPASAVKVSASPTLSMQEMLSDPDTVSLGATLYSALSRTDEETGVRFLHCHLREVLGKLADYQSEELLFTENELFEVMNTMISLNDIAENNNLEFYEYAANYMDLFYGVFISNYNTEMVLVPTYSMDGGVTATINAYAAVNRNTHHPKEAFSVIDYLMQEKLQRESVLYENFFSEGIPLQNDLGSKEKALQPNSIPLRYLDTTFYENFLEIKGQITAVNFETELDSVLRELEDFYYRSGTIEREKVEETYKKMKRMIGE